MWNNNRTKKTFIVCFLVVGITLHAPVFEPVCLRTSDVLSLMSRGSSISGEEQTHALWVLEAEHILDGSWAPDEDVVNNEQVGQCFDQWHTRLTKHLSDGTLSGVQQECLQEVLLVLSNVRPYLLQCYDHTMFPRTNNDTEREIQRNQNAVSSHQ